MGTMDVKYQKTLQEQDWADISPRLLHFTRSLAAARGIKYIPGGLTPDDVAVICIEKLFNGERTWDPKGKISLLDILKGAAKSLLSKKGYLRVERDRGVTFVESRKRGQSA